MKKFVKNYIGKGKSVDGVQIVKISLKVEDLLKFKHTYKDEDYITFEVAKMQNPDKFGHDYTVYVNRLEEEQISEPVPAPKAKKQTKKSKAAKQEASVEVPF